MEGYNLFNTPVEDMATSELIKAYQKLQVMQRQQGTYTLYFRVLNRTKEVGKTLMRRGVSLDTISPFK